MVGKPAASAAASIDNRQRRYLRSRVTVTSDKSVPVGGDAAVRPAHAAFDVWHVGMKDDRELAPRHRPRGRHARQGCP
jgi:hypothetical protein